jgi:hypothetical protein
MYAVVRRYTFDPKHAAEVNESVKEAFVPLLKEMPGFVAYYWLETGTGAGASLTVFKDEVGAQESIRLAADYAREYLSHIIHSEPDVLRGEVKAWA